jgi:hypothetical protein
MPLEPHAYSIAVAKGMERAVSYSSVIATSSFEALFCLGYVRAAHRMTAARPTHDGTSP